MKNLKIKSYIDMDGSAPLVIYLSYSDEFSLLIEEIKKITKEEFSLLYIYDLDWNEDLTPWPANNIFKNGENFGGKADLFLKSLTKELIPNEINQYNINPKYLILCGYSLAGLFSFYSMFKTDLFKKIGTFSDSFWYPNFVDFCKNNKVLQGFSTLYISLGDREKYTKNIYMKTVEDDTLALYNYISQIVPKVKFEFNQGNHFHYALKRSVNGIKYLLEN